MFRRVGSRVKRRAIRLPSVARVVARLESAKVWTAAGSLDDDRFFGSCRVCGAAGVFVRKHVSLRNGYRCTSCKASLRYQGQADALLRHYAANDAESLAELVSEPGFAQLAIWEPGMIGPFRKYLQDLPDYVQSNYWPDVPPGDLCDGIRCEDVTAVTFPDDSFDLVITSDIFEHVRRPYVGFAELHRVLQPGGRHVFSIPVQEPMPSTTVERVDTSGDEDVYVLEPRYHYGPNNTLHIVYNDFGRDLVERLSALGFDTEVLSFDSPSTEASRLVTFSSLKRPVGCGLHVGELVAPVGRCPA